MNKFLALIIGSVFIFGCKEDPPKIDIPVDNSPVDTIVELSTNYGVMHLYMYKGTPLHRANFHKLVKEGFYDSTEFRRIIPMFMIQGGDPLSKDDDRTNDGTGGPGYVIPAEIDSSKYKHIKGAVAAARLGDATNPQRNSSGSQFYIVVDENGTKHLNGAYTVFGRVLKNVEVADSIVIQPRNSTTNRPNERIKMAMKLVQKTANQIKTEYNFDVE